MKTRIIISLVFILTMLAIPVYSHAENVEVDQGVNISEPTNTGGTNVNIPIQTPPGRNGIAPNLSLSYSSGRGNSWIGLGWDLSLGAIQRSTKKGLNYNINDFVVVMNGSTSDIVARGDWGTNYYGAKIEKDFNRYYYNPSSGGWEVTAKNGTKYYYGTTAASRQDFDSGTKVFKWCLDKVEDLNGNYMTVTYTKDQGEIYLYTICYTGNVDLYPTNQVTFILESRTDVPVLYTTNYQTKTAMRLQAIRVNSASSSGYVRKYILTYSSSGTTARSMLTTVTRYGSDGVTTLPVKTFTYQPGNNNFNSGAVWGSGFTSSDQLGDFNGDGKIDVIRFVNGEARVSLSNGSGFNSPQVWDSGYTNPINVSASGNISLYGQTTYISGISASGNSIAFNAYDSYYGYPYSAGSISLTGATAITSQLI